MKLGTGTNSTTGNLPVTLSTTGHSFFEWSSYHLITWNLMKLSMGTKSTMKNSLIILSTIWSLIFRMVTLSTDHLLFCKYNDEIKYGYQIDHGEFTGHTFDHWSLIFRMVILSSDNLEFDEIKYGY
jgi:hypothetical protein